MEDTFFSVKISAACPICFVLEINPNHGRAVELKKLIKTDLDTYYKKGKYWLAKNRVVLLSEFNYLFPQLQALVDVELLDFDRVAKLEKGRLTLLGNLCDACMKKMNVERFIEYCKPFDNPPSTSKKEMATTALEEPAKVSPVQKPSTASDTY